MFFSKQLLQKFEEHLFFALLLVFTWQNQNIDQDHPMEIRLAAYPEIIFQNEFLIVPN